jgi:trans-aconitate methyltransferase
MRREGLQSLVDVGCGVGMKLEWIHQKLPLVRLIGIDQPRAIKFCLERHPFGEWYVDNFENQPTKVGAIQGHLVLCADVIEHVLDPDRLLQYLRERLAPDGWILISTPERDLVRGRDCLYSPNPAHIREWNKTEFQSYLCTRGFRIVEHNLDPPVRVGLNRFALQETMAALLRGRSLRYNQVCLVKPV